MRPDGLAISVITYGEVTEGVLFDPRRAANMQIWRDFLAAFDVIQGPLVDINHGGDLTHDFLGLGINEPAEFQGFCLFRFAHLIHGGTGLPEFVDITARLLVPIGVLVIEH